MKEKYVTENPLLMLAIMRFFFSLYSSGGEEMRSGKGKGKKEKKKKEGINPMPNPATKSQTIAPPPLG